MIREATEYEQLRDLLLSPEVAALHGLGSELEDLRHQLQTPERAAKLLGPVMARVIQQGSPELHQSLVKAVTPFLDEALRERISQDANAMAAALAPVSTAAIAQHYANAPHTTSRDIGPLVSNAIKEQFRSERDAMIDALYPVMGSTISKYLSHTLASLVQTINERIESNLGFKSLTRKFRARLLGVSEAELILRESVSWSIDAAFLIHKTSGLVIAQAQNPAGPVLDSDLLSGMLTALRSLFNDSVMKSQEPRELDQIEYGDAKIVLEVAGHCYLAAITRGIPGEGLRRVLRETMIRILNTAGDAIEHYAGNEATVPETVAETIRRLVHRSDQNPVSQPKQRPYGVAVAAAVLLLVLAVPLMITVQRNRQDRNLEQTLLTALRTAKPAPLAGVSVEADRGVVHLKGKTLNELQRTRAEEVVKAIDPAGIVENGIIPDPSPSLPLLTEVHLRAIVATLNTMEGVLIAAQVSNGELLVTGWMPDQELREKIDATFDEVRGIRAYRNTAVTGETFLPTRIHFDLGSFVIRGSDQEQLSAVREYLLRFPSSRLLIIGHSDLTGREETNRRLADDRANAARRSLAALGVAPTRMRTEGSPAPPPGSPGKGADLQSRCVRFKLTPQKDSLLP